MSSSPVSLLQSVKRALPRVAALIAAQFSARLRSRAIGIFFMCQPVGAMAGVMLADRGTWIRVLRENQVSVIETLSATDLYSNVQFKENNVFIRQKHPETGSAELVGFTDEFEHMENVLHDRATLLGEQTVEIMTELGYTKESINRLRGRPGYFRLTE